MQFSGPSSNISNPCSAPLYAGKWWLYSEFHLDRELNPGKTTARRLETTSLTT